MNLPRTRSLQIVVLALVIFLSSNYETQALNSFSNVVEYPTERADNKYSFEFMVTQGMSMSVWNMTRKTYQPVLKRNGSFFLRNRMSSSSCDSLTRLENNSSFVQSIITAAGRHRYMMLVNRQFPGTPIVVPFNSIVEVKVKNGLLTEAISFHWHGQTQKGTFYMDGVSRLTQCSIGPGESFVYRFRANDEGTHFYHAHVGLQRNEGLYGPFVVTPEIKQDRTPEPPEYEKEFYFIVHDWYQESSNSLYNRVIWEDIRYSGGFGNLKSCYRSNRIDDGTAGVMLPFDRQTDAILINGKVNFTTIIIMFYFNAYWIFLK